MIDRALVDDVALLCLDAGNTVIFLDHARLARLVTSAGHEVTPEALVRTEGEAKALAESGGMVDVPWTYRDRPGAVAWGKMVGTIAARAGLPEARVPALLDAAWVEHERLNLWCKVPDGLGEALDTIRGRGVKVAIISNSEGMLDRLFTELGILGHFDRVVDSGKVGVEKPDPRIFEIAMRELGVTKERTLHLGDVFATDVLGARAAGIRHALIDPFGHYTGKHLEVPRVPGAVEVARAIAGG
ncbi:MAG: HAD-IA family hydrolase [Deltaproteobacteria bacterium]|nr:HAD-IA family hydrolase [Deltaproteobacteria bacterium]